MKHRASPRFWRAYRGLPREVRALADRSYQVLKANPAHPSLHFKKVGQLWSARIGLHYRALAVESGEDRVWFWIGSHADYDALVGRKQAKKRLPPTAADGKPKKRRRPKGRRG